MKFEISDNKLEQVFFRYLDNKNFFIKETLNNYHILENETDEYSKIVVNKLSENSYVVLPFLEELQSFFSINRTKVLDFLTKYFHNTFNIKINRKFWNIRPDDFHYMVAN